MAEVEERFQELVAHLDYPMFIVTTSDGARRAGCLVGFCTQCSIDPPRFVVFLSNKNFTYRVALDAEALAVHVVPADAGDLASLFGEETGDEVDKFERCGWIEGPLGLPVVDGCADRFVGRIVDRFSTQGGDHVGFVLEPLEAYAGGGSFLAFSQAKELEPGHEA
ncbi:MAG: flavin reductase family protein [Actinomycetota bacterium]|nr:flavin reductase family protein [Actinomycetota bacterium]